MKFPKVYPKKHINVAITGYVEVEIHLFEGIMPNVRIRRDNSRNVIHRINDDMHCETLFHH